MESFSGIDMGIMTFRYFSYGSDYILSPIVINKKGFFSSFLTVPVFSLNISPFFHLIPSNIAIKTT